MSQTPTQSDGQIIQRLLDAARSGAAAGGEGATNGDASPLPAQADAVDYDWTAPCRFVRAQLAKLDEFARKVASNLSESLSGLLREELEFVPAGVTQHFGSVLEDPARAAETKEYWVELTQSGRACGLIALSAENAISWVARLLGGEGSPTKAERDLSAMERAVLLDLIAAMSEACSAAAGAAGTAFARGENVSKDQYSLPGGDAEEYCRIAFATGGSDQNASVSFVVCSDVLELVLCGAPQDAGKSSDDIRRDVLARLESVCLLASAWLGKADILVRDIMALEAGDVILIEKNIDEPIDLVVQERMVASALPVVSAGRYALKIVKPAGQVAGRSGDPATSARSPA